MKKLLLLVLFNVLLIVPRPAAADQVLIFQATPGNTLAGSFVNNSGQVAFETINTTDTRGIQQDRIWVTPPADTGSVAPTLLLTGFHLIPPPFEPYLIAGLDGIDDLGIVTVTALALTHVGVGECTILTCSYSFQTVLLDTGLGTGHETSTFSVFRTGFVETAALYRVELVPEPSTWLLLGSGLVGLGLWGRKRRREVQA